MTFTLAWLGAALVFSLIFWNRPAVVLSAVVLSRILIPGLAEGFLTPVLHPAMYLLVAHIAVQAAFARPRLMRALRRRSLVWTLTLIAVIALMMVDGLNPYGSGPLKTVATILQIVLLPVILFLLIRDEVAQRPQSFSLFVNAVLLVSVFEAVLAVVQVEYERAFFWERLLSQSWFLEGDDISRAVGTLGHGIQVGTLMTVATVLTFAVRYVWLRFALIILFVYATLVAEARVGFVLALIAAAVVALTSLRRRPIVSAAWGAVGFFGLLQVFNSEAGLVLQRKFVDDGTSTQLRVMAARWFMEHWPQFAAVGFQGPRNLREGGYLASSLENGYFIFAMLFGVVCAALYLLLQLGTVLRAVLRRERSTRSSMLAFAAATMLVSGVGSSAFMAQGPDGFLYWALCGMAFVGVRRVEVRDAEAPVTDAAGTSSLSRNPAGRAHAMPTQT